jgi:hypothetical protein
LPSSLAPFLLLPYKDVEADAKPTMCVLLLQLALDFSFLLMMAILRSFLRITRFL